MNQDPKLCWQAVLSQCYESLKLELEDHGRQFAATGCSRLHIRVYLKDAIRQVRRKVKWCVFSEESAQLLSVALYTKEQHFVQPVLCKPAFVLVLEVSLPRDKRCTFLEVISADLVPVTMAGSKCPLLSEFCS
jgi:hypothetical protein